MKLNWKKGRGKLGAMAPLLGNWEAEGKSPMGTFKCTRSFNLILGDKYIELNAKWYLGDKVYEEQAIIGAPGDTLSFWSFTSDGKRSEGHLADGTDLHKDAICFEAQMPAGLARMVYWPDEDGITVNFAVESKNKQGWNRFVHHRYKAV